MSAIDPRRIPHKLHIPVMVLDYFVLRFKSSDGFRLFSVLPYPKAQPLVYIQGSVTFKITNEDNLVLLRIKNAFLTIITYL